MLPIFKSREDKLKPYLESEVKNFIFTEISPEFLDMADLSFMRDIPIPIRQEDLKAFTENGLSTTQIADNIAVVIGCDTKFKYVDNYLQYLHKLFDEKLILVFANKGEECLKIGNYRKGLAYLRAAMMFKDDALESMFCYANGCRFWYLSMEGDDGVDDLILLLKNESREYFEHCTSAYPQFPQGWYYLGYAYLNMGQYQRTQIAWRHYMSCCGEDDPENIKEIEGRLVELEDPVKIEKGVNDVYQSNIVKFAEVLNTSIAYLMGWDETSISDLENAQLSANAYQDEVEIELAPLFDMNLTKEEAQALVQYAKFLVSQRG